MSSVRKLRLDRLLANLGYGSRREIQQWVRAGRIRLDEKTLEHADERIALTADLCLRLRVDEEPLDPLPGFVLMMHKPLGCSCSHKEHGPLVYDLLPARWRVRQPSLSTVGRLDKDTSGLLLFTDDGALLHKITAPKKQIVKRYRVTLDRPLLGNEAELFASGTLVLEGEGSPLLPALLTVHSPTTAIVEIKEGRYHQVRRMFAATQNHVLALHREAIGHLPLPADLAPGAYRFLTEAEVRAVLA